MVENNFYGTLVHCTFNYNLKKRSDSIIIKIHTQKKKETIRNIH